MIPHQQGSWQPLLVSKSHKTCSVADVPGGVGIGTGVSVLVGSKVGVGVNVAGFSVGVGVVEGGGSVAVGVCAGVDRVVGLNDVANSLATVGVGKVAVQATPIKPITIIKNGVYKKYFILLDP